MNRPSPIALRGRHLLAIDLVSIALAFALAFAMRLDVPERAFVTYLTRYLWLLGPLLLLRIGSNLHFRLYQRLWRYASVEEMRSIVLSTSVASLLFGILVLGLSYTGPGAPAYGFPRSIVGIEWLLSTAFLGGSRFSLRTVQAGRWVAGQRLDHAQMEGVRRALIVGAGDAGAAIARELRLRPRLAMEPVGFIDDDPNKQGMLVHEIKVIGNRSQLRRAIEESAADTVIVAMPTAAGSVIRQVLQSCEKIGVRVMTLPGIAELISGQVTLHQIRPVQVEDLLRREPAHIDLESIAGFIEGATVLVTGAGGSIGSELCRQIVGFHPQRLLLLGRGENSIYQIHQELLTATSYQLSATSYRQSAISSQPSDPGGRDARAPSTHRSEPRTQNSELSTELVPLIADIRDLPRLKTLLREYRPTVVFHAAAHKHVPLMEANPSEAVATNVFGTRNLLDAAEETGVETFVLVSTDKAVNPTNVMGATKRIAELMMKQAAARTGRRYVAVRFGNVLGSRGSVVPLFKRQIEGGGPVTVTHPEITRYFMTVPEASQLIIQAAAMGRGGEIFVLDMGEPIRIYDLALDLIRLSGLEPFQDVDVKITGLRRGEKLYEELFTTSEERLSTRNSRIFVSSLEGSNSDHLWKGLHDLSVQLATGCADEVQLRRTLATIVPEFRC